MSSADRREGAAYEAELYFSYRQFLVYDAAEDLPGCDWTDGHLAQGFARRNSTVCVSTALEFGHAHVRIFIGPFRAGGSYTRIIEVPFEVRSGQIVVGGPEDFIGEHRLRLPPGPYRLVVAQTTLGTELEAADLYLEPLAAPLARSRVVLADELMNPPDPLLETAEIA